MSDDKWVALSKVASSKAANSRAVSSRAASRNLVNKTRRPDAKVVSKAANRAAVASKAVSKNNKTVRLFANENPPASRRGIFLSQCDHACTSVIKLQVVAENHLQ
jgi:hypothetical protein